MNSRSQRMPFNTLALYGGFLGQFLSTAMGLSQVQAEHPPHETVAVEAKTDGVTLKITAKGNGLPVGKAEVKINGETLYSDAEGRVKIKVPDQGNGIVTVVRKGFERLEIKFADLRPNGEFGVHLYPGTPDDTVILVQGKRNSAVSRKSVSIEEAAKIAPGGDPAQIVKLLPGVHAAGRGAGGRGGGGPGGGGSQIIVQGSGPHDSRYFVDDLEVPFIFHAIGNLSVIPGDLLDSVDFESAGFGTEHGDATGGIITLRTKNEIPERPRTSFVTNIPFYSGFLYTAPLSESSSLTVGARRSYIDFFIQKFIDARTKNDKSASVTLSPYFSDGDVQYLKKTEDGYFKVTLLGALDGTKALIPVGFYSGTDGHTDVHFYTKFLDFGVERAQRLDKDWKYVTTPQIYYYRSTAKIGEINSDSSVIKLRVPTQFTRRLGKEENLYLGFDPDYTIANSSRFAPKFQFDDPTFDIEDAPLEKSDDVEKYSSLAGWASVDSVLGSLVVTPGLRVTHNGQIKETVADPRIRTRYALTEANTLKAAAGQYSESPQPAQAAPESGNPDLHFIKSYHYVLGVDSKWNEAWTTEVSVYSKTGHQLVESDSDRNYANKGDMHSKGLEIMIRRNLTGRLFGWLSYTYSKTEERPSKTEAWRTATYDQTHVLTVVGDYRLTGLWDIGGRYDHHTGGTYDTISHSVFNSNLDKYQARPEESDINKGRVPASNSITAYFTRDILYDTWKLALRFGVEQYWYKPQVSSVEYNYNFTKTVDSKSLTTIPFIEVKGEL